MTKLRFTDCLKWSDPWFMELPGEIKLLWIYLCDSCDNCGVWDVNHRLAEFVIGTKIDWLMAVNIFEGRVTPLAGGKKWHLSKFLSFQYPGGLGDSKPHEQVIRLLLSHGISLSSVNLKEGGVRVSERLSSRLSDSLPDIDQDTDTDQTQTRPDTDQTSSKGDARGKRTEPKVEIEAGRRERFILKLTRLRLASESKDVEEWIGFGKDFGADSWSEIESCIEACVRKARKEGIKVRFPSHVESFGPGWETWNNKNQAAKESA